MGKGWARNGLFLMSERAEAGSFEKDEKRLRDSTSLEKSSTIWLRQKVDITGERVPI